VSATQDAGVDEDEHGGVHHLCEAVIFQPAELAGATAQQIQALGPALSTYLDEFADCFVSPDTRYHLKEYAKGQLSDLRRKTLSPCP
jgi:hypothetical protein